MTYTMREWKGTSYGEAQRLGEGNGTLTDIREVAKTTFVSVPVTVSKRHGIVTIRGKDTMGVFEYGVWVEPHTHPDN